MAFVRRPRPVSGRSLDSTELNRTAPASCSCRLTWSSAYATRGDLMTDPKEHPTPVDPRQSANIYPDDLHTIQRRPTDSGGRFQLHEKRPKTAIAKVRSPRRERWRRRL